MDSNVHQFSLIPVTNQIPHQKENPPHDNFSSEVNIVKLLIEEKKPNKENSSVIEVRNQYFYADSLLTN